MLFFEGIGGRSLYMLAVMVLTLSLPWLLVLVRVQVEFGVSAPLFFMDILTVALISAATTYVIRDYKRTKAEAGADN